MQELEFDNFQHALSVLRSVFLFLFLAAVITQFVLGEVDIFPLILGILIYCLLGGERMVSNGYRVHILLILDHHCSRVRMLFIPWYISYLS